MNPSLIQPAELETLIYWVREREAIRVAKTTGAPKPWTSDQLLRDFRWCNVRRMDDRVSQQLFRDWYPRSPLPFPQMVTLAVLARMINWPDTLVECFGPRPQFGKDGRFAFGPGKLAMERRAARGEKLITGAYMIPGIPGTTKPSSITDLAQNVYSQALRYQLGPTTMQALWRWLQQFDTLGSFIAGQIAADVAEFFSFLDHPTWAPLGPGSARGINRLFGRQKDERVTQQQFDDELPVVIQSLRERVPEILEERQLRAMDIQNCLCEFDKYRRLTLGEGRVRSRYDGVGIGSIAPTVAAGRRS
ncbi:MAG TPA: nucleotide kinase domain-containing protein [Solimonas sp.]|nr:nucleotide kinase domain-containing protein [Solimonas sp.]